MNRPLCSVIIPAFNVERYVATAIESALAQTYRPLEVIVVNDGSSDGTAAAIAPFSDRIVYIEQQNRGLAGARNRALEAAGGTVVALLDADDTWLPERAERCMGHLEGHPEIGFVTTDAFLLEEDEPTDRHFYGTLVPAGFPAPPDQLAALARHNFMFVSAFVRRDLLDRHGHFCERLRRSEDYDLWLRFVLAGEKAGFVDECLALYRLRSDSLSADGAAQWAAHLSVLERHLPELWRRGVRCPGGPTYEIALSLARRAEHRRAARCFAAAALDRDLKHGARAKCGARALVSLARWAVSHHPGRSARA